MLNMKKITCLICLLFIQQALYAQQTVRYEMNPAVTVSYTQDWINSRKFTLSADASLAFKWVDGLWSSGNYGTNHNLYLYKNGVPYMWVLDNGAVENTIQATAGDQFGMWIGGAPAVSGSATYEVTIRQMDMTVISPAGGIVRPDTIITILPPDGFPNSQIFFTIDGTVPTTNSPQYLYPFRITDDMTVKAVACCNGLKSPVNSKTFQIGWVPPEIFPASAGFQTGDEVEVTVTNSPGNNGEGTLFFRYTYGPGQTAWTQYVNPILVTETSTIEAKVVGFDGESDIVSATYTFVMEKVATPVISPTGGVFTELPAVEITCTTQGAAIYYTVNGTEPAKSSSLYSGPISIAGSCRVKAFAAKANMGDSDKVSRAYILDDPLPQGNGSDNAYNDYLDTRNGYLGQYGTSGGDGLLDDIIRLDDSWKNTSGGTGDSGGSGNTGGGNGTGDTTGGDSGGGSGTGTGGTGTGDSGTGNTGDSSGGTTAYTTNEGDKNYYTTSNTYNSYDNSSGNTDYLGLGAVGVLGILPFMMKHESHPSIYNAGEGNGESTGEGSWAGRIYFTK